MGRHELNGLDDPALQQHLAGSPDEIRERCRRRLAEIIGAMAAGDLGAPIRVPHELVAWPLVTEVDLPSVRVEVEEINGHVVLWVQPEVAVPPRVFSERVLQPVFADVAREQDSAELGLEWSLETEPEAANSRWLVWVHHRALSADAERTRFVREIPGRLNTLIDALRADAG